jgi:hypothetical protein
MNVPMSVVFLIVALIAKATAVFAYTNGMVIVFYALIFAAIVTAVLAILANLSKV